MKNASPIIPQKLVHLIALGKLSSQLNPGDPHVAVLVLASDHHTILDCELRPVSELAAALAIQESNPTSEGDISV